MGIYRLRFVSVLFSICIVNALATAQTDASANSSGLKGTAFGLPVDVEAEDGVKKEEIFPQFGRIPAFFIENQGQIDKKVKYYFKGNDNIYFTDDGVVFQKIDRIQGESEDASRDTLQRALTGIKARNPQPATLNSLTYRLDFIGAKPTCPQTRNELKGKVNYLIGNNRSKWHTNIPTYQEIAYPELYEGIDMVYKGVPGGMKYEFVVRPGAIPDAIRLAYTGIEGLSIDDAGNLIIHTALGDVKDAKPYCYQEIDGKQVEVACNFRIGNVEKITTTPHSPPSQGGDKRGVFVQTCSSTSELTTQDLRLQTRFVYGFEVASYNKAYPLIIDPGLEYSTFLGGRENDWGTGIAVYNGYAYVTGGTYDAVTDFPTTPGAYNKVHNGNWDVFVTKLNLDGTDLEYSTFLGGMEDDIGYDIAVYNGYAYVTGGTQDAAKDFPTTPGAYDETHNGFEDVFVTKLNLDGSALEYSTFLGGSEDDEGRSIAVYNGYAYVTGWTGFAVYDFPTTPGAYDRFPNGETDAFVTKLNSDGSALEYSTLLGGSEHDEGRDIAVDGSGKAYVTGVTYYVAPGLLIIYFPTTAGAYDRTHNGDSDVFVTKLNSDGSALKYSTLLGGGGYDFGYGVAVYDKYAYVTGVTYDAVTDFPTTPGAYDRTHNDVGFFEDAFVTKLNLDGSALEYSTFLGGFGNDEGWGIAVYNGYAYVTGWTNAAATFPTTPGAYDETHNGGMDVFVTKLNSDGSALEYSTFLGGSGADRGIDIAVYNGYAYVTGGTYDAVTDFPTRGYDRTHNGSEDAFAAKLDLSTGLNGCQCPDDSTPPTGCISGLVTDIAGNPLAGKKVILVRRTPTSAKWNTETDVNGCYYFTDLVDGTYKVKLNRRQCGRVAERVIIDGGEKVNDVNLVCQ